MSSDSSNYETTIHDTGLTLNGEDLWVVRLIDQPDTGYITTDENAGSFRKEEHSSSFRIMGCIDWFGPGERYPDPETALARMADRPGQERGEDGLYPV